MITETLLHTIRSTDGNWPFPFGSVQKQTDLHGPDIGDVLSTACATNRNGDLQVCVDNGVAIQ
jgi:hypothetical protein